MKTTKVCLSLLAALLLLFSLAACGTSGADDSAADADADAQPANFPAFQGTDFSGQPVDDSLLKQNSVTVLNFWFNGCSACVEEIPLLEKLSHELRARGAELVGVNVEAPTSDKAMEKAREILRQQGGSYRNLALHGGKEALSYLQNLFAFPSTVLVDRQGRILGQPIAGSLDEARVAEILAQVDRAVAAEKAS